MLRGNVLLARTDPELTGNSSTDERNNLSSAERNSANGVLLIDDHSLYRQCLAMLLQQEADIDVTLQAESLADARRALTERGGKELALAIVDLELLSDRTDELISELQRSETPVLAITTRNDTESLGREFVADEVLTTAASSDEILSAVRRLTSS
jgi:DNA-binding NarL/FixJ family response regulator